MTNLELDEIAKAANPELAIHILVFDKYKELGYAKTQDWIRQTLMNWVSKENAAVKEYLRNRVNENEQFEPHKDELLNLSLKLDSDKLESWVYNMNRIDFSKQSIFEILSELFVFIQFNPKTENSESYYNLVADVLDRFTYLGKEFKILPNEPDCK